MIIDVDLSQIRASAAAGTVEAALVSAASEADRRPLGRGFGSDPLKEWCAVGPEAQTMAPDLKIRLPDLEWTEDYEGRFARLAGLEATGQLTWEDQQELERLSVLRRCKKNPRLGEELVWEYQQRELTHGLIKALEKYVSFHKSSHHPESAEASIH
jgi:hypothetical protein